MKQNNYVLIYDDACPLCAAYTNGFVKAGLLNAENRKSFSNCDKNLFTNIDINKSVDEIPLIDQATNKVYYGIDALLEILNQKLPFIKAIGNIRPVKWFLQSLYKFISYNRKVIVATQAPENGFDCSPAFNIRYRLLFLCVFLLFNTVLLFPMHHYVIENSLFRGTTIFQLQLAHGLFVSVNIVVGLSLGTRRGLEYLGQVNMLALLVILLNIPLILLNQYGILP